MPDNTLPDAVAVLDAKRVDSVYSVRTSIGMRRRVQVHAGICQKQQLPVRDLEKLLELTAVSIASDIVPITGENRILAYYGLKQLNSNPSLGLKGLLISAASRAKRSPLATSSLKSDRASSFRSHDERKGSGRTAPGEGCRRGPRKE